MTGHISDEKFWTDARVARLKELAELGWSFLKISIDLKVSRNAVIGKAHRIGVKTKNPPPVKRHHANPPKAQCNSGGLMTSIRARAGKVKSAPKISRRSFEPPVELHLGEKTRLPMEQPHSLVSLFDAKEHQCRWPASDTADNFLGFCGADRRDENVSYCVHHCRIAFASA